MNSRRAIVRQFLLDTFKNAEIYTADNIKVGMSNKSANKLARLTDNNQQEIALYSDKLVQIGEYDKTVQDNKTENPNSQFRYYNSYIAFGDDVYDVYLNIHSDSNGNRLYDINKITPLQHTNSEGWGSRGDSTQNINEDTENVNTKNTKYALNLDNGQIEEFVMK